MGAAVLAGCSSGPSTAPVVQSVPVAAGPWDWPTYGHDAQHTFHGRTTLTQSTAKRLKVAWFFPTADVVTATPTVVDGTVYAGSWDDTFYALDLQTGAVRWTYRLSPQDAVTPYPGQEPRDATSDGGLVTASAWYQSGSGTRPDLVIFAGGYTLYALDAATGALYWRHDYTGRPGSPPDPDKDGTRIFSSPVVVGDKVLFGVDVDGQNGERGYVAAADLDTGKPVWELQTDVDAAGHVLDDGCGSVWSSGTVLPGLGLVVFDTADCDFSNVGPLSEAVIAVHVDTGKLAWVYRPPLPSTSCDWDFGATPNAGVTRPGDGHLPRRGGQGRDLLLAGPGHRPPGVGHQRRLRRVLRRVHRHHRLRRAAGVRLHRPRGFRPLREGQPDPVRPVRPTGHGHPGAERGRLRRRHRRHRLAGRHGRLLRAHHRRRRHDLQRSGHRRRHPPGPRRGHRCLVTTVKVPGPIWSGVATVGDALVTGIGSSYTAHPAGIAAITPGGAPPVVPRSSSSRLAPNSEPFGSKIGATQ